MKRICTLSLLLFFVLQGKVSAQLQALSVADTLKGCIPVLVTFRDVSTGNPTSFCWDFDDGATPTCNNSPVTVTHIFDSCGVYNVRHWVSNGIASDTEYILIRVYCGPKAAFTASDTEGCAPLSVYFANQTIVGESAIKDVVWDYQDPFPTTNYNGFHTYNQGGQYQASLLIRDFNGCESKLVKPAYINVRPRPRVSLTANPAQSCTAPRIVQLTATITTATQGPYYYEWRYLGENLQSTPVTSSTGNYLYNNGIYDAFVIVTDFYGCKDTAFTRIQITDLIACFDWTPTTPCAGAPVQFNDCSNFSSGWGWNFGDPASGNQNTSTIKNPTHIFNAPGCYTVTLPIRFNACRDTISRVVCVRPSPTFTFSANQTYQCTPPFAVNFTANPTSNGIVKYDWDFGDPPPQATTGTTASHVYNAEGNFTVRVTATSDSGCTRTVTQANLIRVKDVNAGFTVNRDSGCAPLTVRFASSSSGQAPLSYHWFWGDGTDTVTAGTTPSHTYVNDTTYKPFLVVTNGAGCKDTFVFPRLIKAGLPTIPKFFADPLIQCVNKTIKFINETDTMGLVPPPTFLWDFGDNSKYPSSGIAGGFEDTVYKFYTDTGTFDITLTVYSQGCRRDTVIPRYIHIVEPQAKFDFITNCADALQNTFTSTSIGADSLNWDFGNGFIGWSADTFAVHRFDSAGTYSVLLWVKNVTTGCDDSIRKTVTVGVSSIGFTADTFLGCLPLTVRFQDTSVYANSWRWDFGDPLSGPSGNTSSQKNPTHTYTRAGIYSVLLILNPNSGCPDTLTKAAYIRVNGVSAVFQPIPPAGCIPLNVSFRDSSTSFMGTVAAWSWTFGDPGSAPLDTSSSQNTSHVFNSPGNYYVRLRVTDSNGCTKDSVRIVRAVQATANFTADTAVCPGDSVVFTNLSTSANSVFWNFGDGSFIDTGANPRHAYSSSGIYTITLIAVNDTFNCTDTLWRSINISLPNVDFYDTSGFAPCPPFPVKFFNTSNIRPGYSLLWDFGDCPPEPYPRCIDSVTFEPIHVYFFPGDYDVSLTLIDTNGVCRVTKIYYDLVRIRGPIGNFRASNDSGCTPLTMCITGSIFSTFSIVADMGNGDVVPFSNLYGQSVAPNLCYTYDSAGTYYPVYILRDSLNCTVAYPVDTIVVGGIPYPNLPADTTVCEGNYVQFNLPLGDQFQWRSRPTPTYLSCEDCPNPVSTSPDTITYYVTATTNIGCFARDTITLNVDPLPDVFPGLLFRICPGDTLQLSAGNGVSSATWSPPLFIDDTTAVNPRVWPPDTQTYRVTAFNQSGCSISRVVEVVPIQSVSGTLSPRDTVICEGASVQFDAQVLDASIKDTSILWTPTQYLNSSTIYNPVLHAPAGDYIYHVNISSSTCTPYEDSVHVLVSPYPNLEAGDNLTVAEGTTVNLWASSSANVVYTWTPTVDTLSCTVCRTPYFNPIVSQYVYVEVTNEYGCTAGDSVYIRVVACNESIVFVPNTFTPNNDNRNDVLYVRGAGLRQLNYFRIFDRWGALVWETNNIGEGWDGTIRGQVANTATFVYTLQAECSSGLKVEKHGNVTLVR